MTREQRILVSGSSGLIGTSLLRHFLAKRISTVVLHRTPGPGRELWDPYAASPVNDLSRLEGTTAAVHLSGANLSGRRWSSSYKREIMSSRVIPTSALATLLSGLRSPPSVLICASAIGIYGGRGEEEITEACSPGNGFLSKVCVAWENATRPAAEAGIRVVHLRLGVVLSPQGGALAKMLPLFRLGLGGRLGSGRQWMSWVALADVIRGIEFAFERPQLTGPVNVVAPGPVTNLQFTQSLGRALHRPARLAVPGFALRLAFGEMAEATILESQRVLPARLTGAGFVFQFPELDAALSEI